LYPPPRFNPGRLAWAEEPPLPPPSPRPPPPKPRPNPADARDTQQAVRSNNNPVGIIVLKSLTTFQKID